MALDGCGQLCKCILILFNIASGILGLVMLGLGLWLRFGTGTQGIFEVNLETKQFGFVVTGLIILGAAMMIVAIFGDVGACSENRAALGVFAFLVTVLAGIEITAGVMAYSKRNWIGNEFGEFYGSLYAQYANTGHPSLGMTLKLIHETLQCCGVLGALDPLVGNTCPQVEGIGAKIMQAISLPTCPSVILNIMEEKAPLVMWFFLGTSAVLVLALVCSVVLFCVICPSYSSSPPYMTLTTQSVPSCSPQEQPLFILTPPPNNG